MKTLHTGFAALGAVFLSLSVPQTAQAQLRTPRLDGVSSLAEYGNEYEASNLSDRNRESLWRVTWDDEFLYVAVEKAILTESAIIYIDSDPQASAGALRGFDYDDTNGRLPFRADAAIFANKNTREYRVFDRERNEWGRQNDYTQTPGFYAESGFIDENQPEKKQPGEYYIREFKVRWADISVTGRRPENFNWMGHNGYTIDGPFEGDPKCNEPGATCEGKNPNIRGGIYGQVPRDNPFGERQGDFTWSYYFTVLNTSAGADNSAFGPALGIPTDRASYNQLNSYTHLVSGNSNFGSFRAYDFSVNTPGAIITRTDVSASPGGTVEWNILGNLFVGANTALNLGNSIAPVFVRGDIVVAETGVIRYPVDAGTLTVGRNLQLATTTSLIVNAGVVLNGSGAQTISTDNNTPVDLRLLTVQNDGVKTVATNLNIREALVINNGILATGSNEVRLVPGARLTENATGYLLGRVSTSTLLPLNTPLATSDFGGIGLRITQRGNDLPGAIDVLRITGGRGLLQTGSPSSPNQTIARRFFINNNPANNSGTNVTLEFAYRDIPPTELNGNTETALRLYESNTNLADPVNGYQLVNPSNSNSVNTTANTLTYTGNLRLNRFFSLADGNTPLPVELVSFTGKAENTAVRLNWATASELQNKGFEVERRTDQSDWQKLGFVAGNGTTNQRHNYSYQDRSPVAGNNYYRLRQIDLDGKSVYSQAVTVQMGAVPFSLSPVPATDVLTINGLGAGKHVAEIYNARGQRVLSKEFNDAAANTVAVSNLPAGVYMVRVLGPGQSTQNARFIKE